MLKFTVLNERVLLDPSLVMISEFTDIIDYGKKKKDKDLANQLLLYIFFCCDLTDANPMKDIDYRNKEPQARRRAFPNQKGEKSFTKLEQKLVDAAIDAYNFFNETALERATLSFDHKIDEIRSLLDKTAPEIHAVYKPSFCNTCAAETQSIDKYVSNNTIISDFSKQLTDLSGYKLRSMETAKKIENTGRVRSGKGSSLIERGVFRRHES